MNHQTKRLNVPALLAALDRERDLNGMTWRAVAEATGTSAATFSRMRHGLAPSVDTYIACVEWLGCSGDRFIRRRL